jgi:hypothetical protein
MTCNGQEPILLGPGSMSRVVRYDTSTLCSRQIILITHLVHDFYVWYYVIAKTRRRRGCPASCKAFLHFAIVRCRNNTCFGSIIYFYLYTSIPSAIVLHQTLLTQQVCLSFYVQVVPRFNYVHLLQSLSVYIILHFHCCSTLYIHHRRLKRASTHKSLELSSRHIGAQREGLTWSIRVSS